MINMTNLDYKKSCTEVIIILNNMPIEYFNKIPTELIKAFEHNKDNDYNFFLDYSKDLKAQNISSFTLAILNNLYRDYWANEEERKEILEKEKYDLNILEQEKREKYNPDNIFKKVKKDEYINVEITENNINTALIEYKESFFTRFKNFILKILHISE
ncbi:MAG: hypothetical protein IJE05_01150 [Clostridia bacterium]|nr:hypothetical protein [Clostridia bacterium]